MKDFSKLGEKYKIEIEQYELNGQWVDDIKDAILSIKNPKEVVLSCLLEGLLVYHKEMIEGKNALLSHGFSEQEISHLVVEYYNK